jgi:uncharacterized protein YkwD
LKRYISNIVILILILCSFTCYVPSILTDYNTYESTLILPETKAIEIEALELINEHRTSLGLNQLQTMSILKSVANRHTTDMVIQSELSHDGFDFRSNYITYKTNAVTVSENVAYGYSNVYTMVDAWLASTGHRRNIESNSTHFDISIEADSIGRWYATNIFIRE